MNRNILALTLLSMSVAGLAETQDPSLQDVLQNHYEAIGGLDVWKSLQSMRATGKMTMGPGMEAPVTMFGKRPGKMRIDFTFQGMTGTQAYNGEKAWMVMPFMGKTEPEEMPADQARQFEVSADIDGPLMGYEEAGHQLELLGLEEIEGTEAYKIKVTLENGDVQYYYLDSEYYVPIRVVATNLVQGKETEFETTLSDYKAVGGMMMAHAIETRQKGATVGQVITVEHVELNVDLEDSLFEMPEKSVPKQEQ